MKPPPFRYVRPDGLEEALAILAEHGDEAKVLAGGCSLVPMLNMRLARPEVLVDVNRLDGLAGVHTGDGTVVTGAMLRQSTFERSPPLQGALPLVAACAPYIGHFVTRNRGTVGGSLVHADARGELPLALLTLGGSVLAESQRGRRSIAAEDLFVYHFTSALEPDELLTEVRWPAASPGWGYGFAEMAQRHGDYALAMAACALRRRNGAVAPRCAWGWERLPIGPCWPPAWRRCWWAGTWTAPPARRRWPRRGAWRPRQPSRSTTCTPRWPTGATW